MNSEKELLIEICRQCYLDCKFCSSNADENSLCYLNLDRINSILKDIDTLKISKIEISGGEPFTHPDFLKICESISEHHIKLQIYTSGNIKKKKNLGPLPLNTLKKLKDLKIDSLRFNLQSHIPKIHNLLTNSNSFKNTISSLKKAIKLGINTEIHIIPLKQNYRELFQTIKFLENLNVSRIKFLRFVAHGRGSLNKKYLELNFNQYFELIRNFIEYKQIYRDFIEIGSSFNNSVINRNSNICRKCQIGRRKIVITPDGNVFPCVSTKNLKIFDFNLNEYSLIQILKSKEYQNRLDEYLLISFKNQEEKKPFINLCPTQSFLKLNSTN